MPSETELRIHALNVQQGPRRQLFAFAVDARALPSFTTVSRIKRDGGSFIHGYQRPEVASHINEIKNYLESEDPMIPNAIVVAFDERVRFEPEGAKSMAEGYSRRGTLVIPVDESLPDADKPGWIVDGQQRLAAIRESKLDTFPMCVIAFIAASDREQREQFILVNSTKPLPKGLIYELLPTTTGKLSSLLQRRRFPAYLLERLNYDPDSPLKGMIGTPTNPEGVIKDNSVIKMLENSLSDGVLYRFRNSSTGEGDVDVMLRILKSYWRAAAAVFSDAWGVPPRRSRLMHGAGIVSMGHLMDAISDRFRVQGVPTEEQFREDLEAIEPICRWTDGYWEFGPGAVRKWNEVQNTTRDIQLVANYLLVQYKQLVWNRSASDAYSAA